MRHSESRNPPRRGAQTEMRQALGKRRPESPSPADALRQQYGRYFVAPAQTPDSFRIFDPTEGASFSFSSHT